mgnify:CR=1 FL=1
MVRKDGGLAWIFKDDKWTACADTLAMADYPHEFTLATCLDAPAVEGSSLAGFMPMSSRFMVPPGFPYGEAESSGRKSSGQEGEPRIFLTPKLHRERCMLDPAEVRITATARRASRHFRVSVNKAFDETLAACIGIHGDGWLTPPLTRVFRELHACRTGRPFQIVSVELWKDDALVAGEIGYAAGTAYASLSGFHRLSGAGTVQLAALAWILAGSGYTIWDLGMPMDYKAALGGRTVSRYEYLPLLRNAYSQSPARPLERGMDPVTVHLPQACVRVGCS